MTIDKNYFADKKICILGDRDGIPGPSIAECMKTIGGEILFTSTECFVWTAAGAMDMANQNRIKETAEQHGNDSVVVILGGAEAESAGLTAETVIAGDPTYAGPLTNIALNLAVFHVFELKDLIDPDIYEEQLSMMEMVLDVDEIIAEMDKIRQEFADI